MPADVHLSLLDQVRIASPCSARWEEMSGDERSRRCEQCRLTVYNLSDMKRDEAEAFLREHLGSDRVCARLYRRADGTILTADCPVGLAAVRAAARRTFIRAAAAFAALLSATTFAQWRGGRHEDYPFSERAGMRDFGLFSLVREWVRSTPAPPPRGAYLLGSIALPEIRTWNEALTNSDDGERQYK